MTPNWTSGLIVSQITTENGRLTCVLRWWSVTHFNKPHSKHHKTADCKRKALNQQHEKSEQQNAMLLFNAFPNDQAFDYYLNDRFNSHNVICSLPQLPPVQPTDSEDYTMELMDPRRPKKKFGNMRLENSNRLLTVSYARKFQKR